jgi:putative ABC transport system permease protein
MRFVSIAVRNLTGRPVRSLLTAFGVALAVAGFIVLTGFSHGMDRAWTTSLVERDVQMTAVPRGTVQVLAASVDEGAARRIAAVSGVRDAAGELASMVLLPSGQPVLAVGWAPGSFLWQTLRLSTGRLPAPADGAVLGQGLAAALRLAPGDAFPLLGARLHVAAVFHPAGVINNNMAIVPLPALQRLLNRPGKVTVIDLRLTHPDDPAQVEAVRARLAAAFPGLTFTETRSVADTNDILRLIRAMAWGISLIALAMGLFTVLNTLLMSVTERVREFGILSALGWSPARVLAMVVIEGVALAAAGSLAGVVLGVAGLRWLAAAPMLRGLLEPEIGVRVLGQVVAATLLLGVAGSLYPAGRAVGGRAVDALKYE